MSAGDAYARAGVSQRRRRRGGGRAARVAAADRPRAPVAPGGRPGALRQRRAARRAHAGSRCRPTGWARSCSSPSSSVAGTRSGIDCVAMNVNDVICVGAEPIAMLDYIAVPAADPDVMRELGAGCARGAERAGIEIPGGELAQLGRDRPRARPRRAPASGSSTSTRSSTASRDRAGRRGDRAALLGPALERLHARAPCARRDPDATTSGSAGRSVTCCWSRPRSTFAAVLELLRSPVEVRGLAHITSGGLGNLLRLERRRRLRDRRRPARAAGLRADPPSRARSPTTRCTRYSTWAAASAASCRRTTRTRRSSCCAATTPPRSASAAPPRRPVSQAFGQLTSRKQCRIAILIFDRLTALDAVGPYEVLSRLPGAELDFVGREAGHEARPTRAGSRSRPRSRSPRWPRPTSSWSRAARETGR